MSLPDDAHFASHAGIPGLGDAAISETGAPSAIEAAYAAVKVGDPKARRGRKPIPLDLLRTKEFMVRLSEQEFAAIVARAEAHGLRQAEYVRAVVFEFVPPTVHPLAQQQRDELAQIGLNLNRVIAALTRADEQGTRTTAVRNLAPGAEALIRQLTDILGPVTATRLRDRPGAADQPPPVDPIVAEQFGELSRIGGNLNQVAHALNLAGMAGSLETVLKAEAPKALQAVRQIMKLLKPEIERRSGKEFGAGA
jgi:hypothetical protein